MRSLKFRTISDMSRRNSRWRLVPRGYSSSTMCSAKAGSANGIAMKEWMDGVERRMITGRWLRPHRAPKQLTAAWSVRDCICCVVAGSRMEGLHFSSDH